MDKIVGIFEKGGLSDCIYRLLAQKGAMTVREIADKLGNPPESVRMTLKRMRKTQKVGHLSDKTWAILSDQYKTRETWVASYESRQNHNEKRQEKDMDLEVRANDVLIRLSVKSGSPRVEVL